MVPTPRGTGRLPAGFPVKRSPVRPQLLVALVALFIAGDNLIDDLLGNGAPILFKFDRPQNRGNIFETGEL